MNRSQDELLRCARAAVGGHTSHCTGFGFGSAATSYVLGTLLSTAVRPTGLSHSGSMLLDEINAFDAAEVATAHMGEINMIQVSSFCGAHGLILGKDVLRPSQIPKPLPLSTELGINVFDIRPCLEATQKLLGTLDKPNFIIEPGSHVPCAGKSITRVGPCELYAGLAIGVDSKRRTALLMEDVGVITAAQNFLTTNLVRSVLAVGENQRVNFDEVYVGVRTQTVTEGRIGCALVAAPYVTLPQWSDERIQDFVMKPLELWNDHV